MVHPHSIKDHIQCNLVCKMSYQARLWYYFILLPGSIAIYSSPTSGNDSLPLLELCRGRSSSFYGTNTWTEKYESVSHPSTQQNSRWWINSRSRLRGDVEKCASCNDENDETCNTAMGRIWISAPVSHELAILFTGATPDSKAKSNCSKKAFGGSR